MAIALDTLAYARRLREAGFTEQQADGQAEALAGAMSDTLVTKQDLGELGSRIDAQFAATKQDLSEVRHEAHGLQIRMEGGFATMKEGMREMELRMDARFEAKLADLERRVTMRLGAVTVAAIGTVSAIVKLLA